VIHSVLWDILQINMTAEQSFGHYPLSF